MTVGLCVLGAILWCVGVQQVWLFWESTRQWTMGFEWFQHPTWLPEGTHISNVGSNGPLPIYIYGLVFGLTHSEWALPMLTTGVHGFNAVWTYRWLRARYGQELAALISLALFSHPILWQLVRAGIEFSFAIILAPYLGYLLVRSSPESRWVTRHDVGFGLLLVAILQFEKTFAPVAPIVAITYAARRRNIACLIPMFIWSALFLLPALRSSHAPTHLSYTWDWAMLERITLLFTAQFDVLDRGGIWLQTISSYFSAGLLSVSLIALVFFGTGLQRGMFLAAFANLVALAYSPESNHHLLVYMVSAMVLLHCLAVASLTQHAKITRTALSLLCISQLAQAGWASWSTHQRGTVMLPNWYPLRSPATIEVPTIAYRQQRIQAEVRSSETTSDLLIDETGWLPIGSEALTSSAIGLVPNATWNAIRGQPLAASAPTAITEAVDEPLLAVDASGRLQSYTAIRQEMYAQNRVMGLAVLPYQIRKFPQTFVDHGATYVVVREANFPLEFYDHRAPKLTLTGVGDPIQSVYSYFGHETWYPIRASQVTLSFSVLEDTLPYYLGLIRFVRNADAHSNGP